MADDDQNTTQPAAEPEFVPSQAEGDRDPAPKRERHRRTPGKAEGDREDVEQALREQENDTAG